MTASSNLSNDLRTMVREVLRETITARNASGLAAVEAVRITTDADLQAFVARLLEPAVMDKIKSGKLRFTLGATTAAAYEAGLLSGVITEKTIDKHASRGMIALAAGAVLTPLARDRARKLGLKIERRR